MIGPRGEAGALAHTPGAGLAAFVCSGLLQVPSPGGDPHVRKPSHKGEFSRTTQIHSKDDTVHKEGSFHRHLSRRPEASSVDVGHLEAFSAAFLAATTLVHSLPHCCPHPWCGIGSGHRGVDLMA